MKLNITDNRVTNWFYQKRMYFYAFFIPAILMYIVYSAFGVYPFGDNSILVLDLNGQYVYYYEAFRDAFWGDRSFFYSWSRNLGGEMAGIYGYYLASPFMLIVCFLPRAWILQSVLVMQLCKIGVMGVTFTYYLKKSKNINSYTTLIFSTFYALMSYVIVQLMDPMWLDGLVYLPLIIYGIEKLIDEKKKLYFIIPLALSFMANFYIGYMTVFFCVIYFFCYLFFMRKDDDNSIKEVAMTCVRFGVGGIISALLASWVLLPTYYSLQLGKLEFTKPDYSIGAEFTILDFFSKLFPQSYDTVRNEGLPFVYCGVLTLIMIPLYYLNQNIDGKKKVGNSIALGAVFLSMYITTVNLAWHGFQVPNWLPYRFSFTFSFIMLVMAAEAFERIEGINYKQIGATIVVIIAYLIFADSKGYDYFETTQGIWYSIVCVLGYALLLYAYRKSATVKTMPLVIMILVLGELFGNSLQSLQAINSDVVYSKHSSYEDYIEEGRETVSQLYDYDNGFYRTEKTFHRTVNDALAFNMYGISHSSSTLNAGPINFLDKLGFASRGHYTKYKGETLMTDALLGIKYVMNKDQPIYYDNKILTNGEISVFKNDNALSIGYMASNKIEDLEIEKGNPFVNQNKLMSDLLGKQYTEYFKEIDIDELLYNNLTITQQGERTNYKPTIAGQNSDIQMLLTIPTQDIVYMYLPCRYSGYEMAMNIYVNNNLLGTYYETDNYTINTLGRFATGEAVTIKAALTKDEANMDNQLFYYLDEDLFQKDLETLKQSQWNIIKHSDTYLEGNVNVTEDNQVLYTTIPYEKGWTVTVDGKKADYEELVKGLIGIPLSKGEHTVIMKFKTNGLVAGLLMSIVGVIIVVFIAIYEKKTSRILLKRLYK